MLAVLASTCVRFGVDVGLICWVLFVSYLAFIWVLCWVLFGLDLAFIFGIHFEFYLCFIWRLFGFYLGF